MTPTKIIVSSLLMISSVICAQKSRLGETAKFSAKANLVSFNNSGNLNYDSLLKIDKPMAIFFWLSTCGPCIKELNAIHKMNGFKEIKSHVKIIVVSDDKPSNYKKATNIAKLNQWEFELFFDKNYRLRNSLLNNWYGVPQIMILDKDKKIVLHKFGYRQGDEHKIVNKLKELIYQ